MGETLPAKMGWPVGSVVRDGEGDWGAGEVGVGGGEAAEAGGLVDLISRR